MASSSSELPPLKNDLLIRACLGQATERAPVWAMRQAGRYLPEFRAVRAEHDFFKVCQTPELACEVTLQPIRRYKGLLDAAIIFSDILVIPQAFGMEVQMLGGVGPHFPKPISSPEEADELIAREVDVDKELKYVYDAVRLTRQKLEGEVPLIGFAGAPWTLLAYMIEGGGGKNWIKAKSWLYDEPKRCQKLLEKLSRAIVTYLVGQVRAGAQAVQVFDSWSGDLTPTDFYTFCLPSLTLIVSELRAALKAAKLPIVPIICFPKGANHAVRAVAEAGYDVVGIDWTIEPSDARAAVRGVGKDEGRRVALQGNLDPAILFSSRESIEKAVKNLVEGEKGFGKEGAWVANLGHGCVPSLDPEKLRWFLECIHKFSKKA